MISSSSLFTTTIALTLATTNAFTAPKTGTLHRSPFSPNTASKYHSSTSASACLDGIYYESSNPKSVENKWQTCELALFREAFSEHSEEYIFNCLTNQVQLEPDEALDVMEQTRKCVAGVMLIDEYDLGTAEYYYEQLLAHGIACTILPIEE